MEIKHVTKSSGFGRPILAQLPETNVYRKDNNVKLNIISRAPRSPTCGLILLLSLIIQWAEPLLNVYGEHLWEDGSKSSFDEALASLQKGERDNVSKEKWLSERLLFVFYKMRDEDAKDAFLDICTFFHEWSRDEVSSIVGETQLKTLERGALLTIDARSKKVIIHDVLRVMRISEAKSSRLQSLKDLKETLKEEEDDLKELKRIKGIWIDDSADSDFNIDRKALDAMSNSLRVLALGEQTKIDGKCQKKFKKLKYLKLGESLVDFPFEDGLALDKLTYLCDKSTTSLKLTELPETLQHLMVYRSRLVDGIPVVLPGWNNMKNLTHLQSLHLFGLELSEFPTEFVLPVSLISMDLSDCTQLQSLPQGIGSLTALMELSLHGCGGLTELPRELGQIISLTDLRLTRCDQLQSLPQQIDGLTALKNLSLGWCYGLVQLPEELGKLSSLTELDLCACGKLQSLPQGIGNLTALKNLSLNW